MLLTENIFGEPGEVVFIKTLVFVTKYRREVFSQKMLNRLNQTFAETCLQMGGEFIKFGGEDDHIVLQKLQ